MYLATKGDIIMSWTDDRVAILKKLWGEGKTAAEIAKELGGVTRNAVIGKAHRLKLSNRVSPIQQNSKKTTNKSSSAGKPPPRTRAPRVKKPVEPVDIIGVQMKDLKEKMCRWPIGDPKSEEFEFCGSESVPSLPYCEGHAKMAYQTTSRSRTLKVDDVVDKNIVKKAASA